MEKPPHLSPAELEDLYCKEELADRYLTALPAAERTTANCLADQLERPEPLASTAVIIPVAAHQEASSIGRAVAEYAAQRTEYGFSLVLGLNTTGDLADSAATATCLRAVDEAVETYPSLDIRPAFLVYEQPATIGKIRRDLWNGVLEQAMRDGVIEGEADVIGINHDIDLIKLPSHYVANVQQRMASPARRIAPAYTQVRHSMDDRFPNISRAVFWNDFSDRMRHIGYEAGAIIPLSYYARKGGFDPSRRTHEIGTFLRGDAARRLVRTGSLITSSRRFIARLPRHGFDSIWTEDSFSHADECREAAHMTAAEDISDNQLHELIAQRLDTDVRSILNLRIFQYMLPRELDAVNESMTDSERQWQREQAVRHFRLQQAMVERVLRLHVGLPELADQIDTRIRSGKLVHESWLTG